MLPPIRPVPGSTGLPVNSPPARAERFLQEARYYPVLYGCSMNREQIPFGKWKGTPWAEIPLDYLSWLAYQPTLTPQWIRETVYREFQRRGVELTSDHLTWLAERPDLTPWLRTTVYRELDQRGYLRLTSPWQKRGPLPIAVSATLDQVRRGLAWQHHPDRGGSPECLYGINLALDAVQAALARMATPCEKEP